MLNRAMTERTTETPETAGDNDARRLVVVRSGGRAFGVYADEIERFGAGDAQGDSLSAAVAPVPLPGAPAAVRGVVAVRGRVYTLIDLARVTNEADEAADAYDDDDDEPASLVRVLPLRGKEQLAIEAEQAGGTLDVRPADIIAPDTPLAAVAGVVRADAAGETSIIDGANRADEPEATSEPILVLDTGALFAAATRGMERRRRRT